MYIYTYVHIVQDLRPVISRQGGGRIHSGLELIICPMIRTHQTPKLLDSILALSLSRSLCK